jgi:hypothetical protein
MSRARCLSLRMGVLLLTLASRTAARQQAHGEIGVPESLASGSRIAAADEPGVPFVVTETVYATDGRMPMEGVTRPIYAIPSAAEGPGAGIASPEPCERVGRGPGRWGGRGRRRPWLPARNASEGPGLRQVLQAGPDDQLRVAGPVNLPDP